MNSRRKSYKWCIVPLCTNTSIKSPNKIFITVPKDEKRRRKWLYAMRRDVKSLGKSSVCFVCEDHFKLEEDMENYMRYKLMENVPIIMKRAVVPHLFDCQLRRPAFPVKPRGAVLKRQRARLIEEALASTQDKLHGISLDKCELPSGAVMTVNVSVQGSNINEQTLVPGNNNIEFVDCYKDEYDSDAAAKVETLPENVIDENSNVKTFELSRREPDTSFSVVIEDDKDFVWSEIASSCDNVYVNLSPDVPTNNSFLLKQISDGSLENSVAVLTPTNGEIQFYKLEECTSVSLPLRLEYVQNISEDTVPSREMCIQEKENAFVADTDSAEVCLNNVDINEQKETKNSLTEPRRSSLVHDSPPQMRECTSYNRSGIYIREFVDSDDISRLAKREPETVDDSSENTVETFESLAELNPDMKEENVADESMNALSQENPIPYQLISEGFSESEKLKQFTDDTSTPSELTNIRKSVFAENLAGNQHRKVRTEKKVFLCTVCSKSFSWKAALNVHMRTHTREKPYLCNLCGKSFSVSFRLNQHIRKHTGEKPFSCSTCGKLFFVKCCLNQHMKTHTGEKPFKCTICGKAFPVRCYLNQHLRIHTGKKQFSCSICGKLFSMKGYLNQHLRTHTGEKPFSCSICGNSFTTRSHLKQHMRTHTRNITCSTCGLSFIQKSELKQHMEKHVGKKSFSCSVCGKLFCRKFNLQIHRKKHTRETQSCTLCGKSFSGRYDLERHIRIHTKKKPLRCNKCGKSFSWKSHLARHMRIHTAEQPFPSTVCEISFTQKQHLERYMRTHSREKTFSCTACGD